MPASQFDAFAGGLEKVLGHLREGVAATRAAARERLAERAAA